MEKTDQEDSACAQDLNSKESRNLSHRYFPQKVEKKIYDFWEKGLYFEFKNQETTDQQSSQQQKNKKKVDHQKDVFVRKFQERRFFSILMPPPNVTGFLHIGHAFDHTLQDVLIRWKRMKGYECLWFPGTDHAGIATQSVVERELRKRGKIKKEMSFEGFQSTLLDWKDKCQKRIVEQCKRIGDSCDWRYSLFTLDEKSSLAVRRAFVSLHKKGWIYKDKALIHWSPKLGSALSDLEVEHKEVKGSLWYIRYPIVDHLKKKKFASLQLGNKEGFLSECKAIVIATTRPETILADTAVAVHPEDKRYESFVGQKVFLPLVGREIPIIEDSVVAKDFGTGAVKVTPGHDFNDFEIGVRNNLEQINILNEDGCLNREAGIYAGLSVLEAREKIVEDLKNLGYLVEVKPHVHRIGHCSRTGCVVEPFLSEQWFMRVKSMARRALLALKEGKVQFIPKMREKTFFHWMDKIEDWCISRQIWWGHRIPAWYCETCHKVYVQEEKKEPKVCSQCNGNHFREEKDVLDTWFSSALWPLSTVDWPSDSKLQEYFYPTDVLITGYDIIFFWVARMMMMGLEFKEEVPFRAVYFHGLIRDSKGQKMSKSLGNALDPLELIDHYGADALRFSFLIDLSERQDIKFGVHQVEGARNFLNKIWNAFRFSLIHLDDFDESVLSVYSLSNKKFLSIIDEWILYRLERLELKVERALNQFDFSEAAEALRDFVWYEFCDWYLEFIKPLLYGPKNNFRKNTQLILAQVLNRIVRLLHPFIPFITEELYRRIPFKREACITEDYPTLEKDKNWLSQASRQKVLEVEMIKDVVSAIRNIRGENKISFSKSIPVHLVLGRSKKETRVSSSDIRLKKGEENLDLKKIFSHHKKIIMNLSKASSFKVEKKVSLNQVAKTRVTVGTQWIDVIVPLKGLLNFEKEIQRLSKSIKKLKKEQNIVLDKLSNRAFLDKAPRKIIEESKVKLKSIMKNIGELEGSLSRYQK